MARYFPVGWTNTELIDQLAYERSKSPLIDQLCQRFEDYMQACDEEMIRDDIEAEYQDRLKEVDECVTSPADCPICSARLSIHIDGDANPPFSLVPYVESKQSEISPIIKPLESDAVVSDETESNKELL